MSRLQKALDRLSAKPRDYTWQELEMVMRHFGYELVTGGGSRRKFFHPVRKIFISLHKPHPTSCIETVCDENCTNAP